MVDTSNEEFDKRMFNNHIDHNLYAELDDIGKLGILACRGSRSAAVHLRRHYSEGPFEDPHLAYKYTCYAALSGDGESIESLRSEGKLISTFFIEDFDQEYWLHNTLDCTISSEGAWYTVFYPAYSEAWRFWGDPSLNVGYRHPDSYGLFELLEIDYIRPEDLVEGHLGPSTGFMFTERPWPGRREMERWIAGEPFGEEYDGIDARFFRDVFQYLGIGIERDEDAAMRDLSDMALQGNRNAADMISYAIGYEPDTFLTRQPDLTEEEMARRPFHTDGKDFWKIYYSVADDSMLDQSPEWRLLRMLMRIDRRGLCDDPEHQNNEGGYEDDVVFTRAGFGCLGPPTFVFKPSGYCMSWYKHAWSVAFQSENLSMGEIRRVMRLCIEHLVYGREIPKGPTKELITESMHLYEPPEDIGKELFDAVCRAFTNRINWCRTLRPRTFTDGDAETAEMMALEILARRGGV